jgi:WD40 repeat protein
VSDAEVQRLERLALEGDPEGRARLRRLRLRTGSPVLEPGETLHFQEAREGDSEWAGAALSDDWRLLLLDSGGVQLLDPLAEGAARRTWDSEGACFDLRAAEDRVLVGGRSPALWSLVDEEVQVRLRGAGHADAVALGPSFAAVVKGRTTLQIHDLDDGALRWQERVGSVTALVGSPAGELLALASHAGSWLIDPQSGARVREIGEPGQPVTRGLCFSPSGKEILVSALGTLRLLETSTGKELSRIDAFRRAIRSVDFSPDGRLIAAGGDDGLVRVWDLESGQELERYRRPWWIMSVRFDPRGEALAFSYLNRSFAGGLWTLPVAVDLVGLPRAQ